VSRARAIRLFWIGAAAALVAAALLALSAVLGGRFDSTDWKILGSLGTLLLAGAAATVGTSLSETNRAAGFGKVLAVGAPVLGLVGLIAMARGFEPKELGKTAGVAYVLLAAGLIIGTARILARERSQLLPFVVVAFTGSLAAFLGIIAIATEDGSAWKVLVAALIVMALAYVLIPVSRRLSGATTDPTVELVDLAQGVEVAGVHVRFAPASTRLGHETVVVGLSGGTVAGTSTVAAGQAVLAPAGTTVELASDGGAILIGR
jgi:drug/metabolite transporter (DMT)-like permease